MAELEIDTLLAEDAWLRRLAGSLTRDTALAEDLVQETWLAALRRPASARDRRPWLGGTLRNLWRQHVRGDGRRAERERAVARDEQAAPADEMIAELSLRRTVVDELLGLGEPERSALFLRFFKDLSTREVARRQGVAVSTAHARLERGLELLRRRLDERSGGERRAWLLGLASIADPLRGVGPTLGGGLLMGTGMKLAAAAVVLAGSLGVWIGRSGPEPERDARAAPRVADVPRAADAPDLPPRPEDPSRAPAAAAESPRGAGAAEAPAAAAELRRGRVVTLSGEPLNGVAVELRGRRAKTAPDGSFAVPDPRSAADGAAPELGEYALSDPGRRLALATALPDGEVLLVAGERVEVAGLVEDEAGGPLAGVALAVRLRHELFRELGVKHDVDLEPDLDRARTDEHGRFRLADAVGGEHVVLHAAKPGYQDGLVELPPAGDPRLVVTLVPLASARAVTGVVLGPDGQPFEGARVSLGVDIVRTNAEGRFTLEWTERVERPTMRRGDDGVWRPIEQRVDLWALAPGFGPARLPVASLPEGEPVVLRLGERPLELAGRVVDGAGEPRAGVQVWLRDPTHFGRHTRSTGESVAHYSVSLEETLAGEEGTTTGEDGRFRLVGLDDRAYDVQAYDPAAASYGRGWTLRPGAGDAVLRLPDHPSCTRVAGRIVSSAGVPHVGLRVRAVRLAEGGADDQPPQSWGGAAITDDEGRFAFPRVAVDGTLLEMIGEGVFYHHVALEDFARVDDLEIVVPRLCELQVTLVDASTGDEFEVLDREGRPLEMNVHEGAFIRMVDRAELVDGRSSVVEVSEEAATLRLLLDDDEVALVPVTVDPARRTEVVL